MRKFFSAVAVCVLALGFSACAQDVSGPTQEPAFSRETGSDASDPTKLRVRCGKNSVFSAELQKCVLVK